MFSIRTFHAQSEFCIFKPKKWFFWINRPQVSAKTLTSTKKTGPGDMLILMMEILEQDPRKSTWELALELGLSHTTVWNQLKAFWKILKARNWVPPKLLEINIAIDWIPAFFSVQNKKKKSFLSIIVTGDENRFTATMQLTKNSGSVLVRYHSKLQNRKFTLKDISLCLVGSEGCHLLWAPRTQANGKRKSLFLLTDTFEPEIG